MLRTGTAKSTVDSDAYRARGNDAYARRELTLAARAYGCALLYAPSGDARAALAHGNRSAVLCEVSLKIIEFI